jgi:HK97 family phage portal protein
MNIFSAYKDWRASLNDGEFEHDGLVSLNLKSFSSMPQQPSSGGEGMGGWGSSAFSFLNYSGTKINYAREVGDLRTSSLLIAASRWVARNLYDARLKVVKYGADRKETEIEDSEIAKLWSRPNKFYSGRTLASGISYSMLTRSIAYLVKVRSSAGLVVELWWEPYETIRPRWDLSGRDFISFYEIWRNGVWIRLEVDDVIAICEGYDTDNRRGLLNPCSALMRDFYTDGQMSHFTAALLKNGLVPAVVVSFGDKERPFTGDLQERKELVERKMSGDDAGKPLVTNDAVKVEKLGFDYSSIGAKDVKEMSEARFCAAMGISAHSLNLSVAQGSSTYNNVKNYLQQDYRGFIKPMHKMIADEFNVQLLPDFGETKKVSVVWDYSQVDLMQPDKLIEARVTVLEYDAGLIDRAEGREAIGYKMRPEDIGVYSEKAKAKEMAESKEPATTELEDEPTKAAKDRLSKKALDDGADSWRNSDALNDKERDLMDAVEYVNGKAN